MKAADGTQIAERWEGLYRTVCTSENPDAATLISLIEELSAAEERELVLRETAVRLLAAAEAIRGPIKYAIDLAGSAGYSMVAVEFIGAYDALRALTAAPEQPAPKPWGFSGYLEVLPDKPSCPGCQQIGATLFLTDDNLTLCKQCIDSSNEDMGFAPEQGKEPTA